MTKQLISISMHKMDEGEVNAVDARELHEFLGVKEHFSVWIKRCLKDYKFTINSDFCRLTYASPNGREMETYILSLDMAKSLALISRTQKGDEVRKYFIKCEKELKKQISTKFDPDHQIDQAVSKFIEKFSNRLEYIMEQKLNELLIGEPKSQKKNKNQISDSSNSLKPKSIPRTIPDGYMTLSDLSNHLGDPISVQKLKEILTHTNHPTLIIKQKSISGRLKLTTVYKIKGALEAVRSVIKDTYTRFHPDRFYHKEFPGWFGYINFAKLGL